MPRGALRVRWSIRARMCQTSCARSPGNTRAALAKSRACVLSAPPLALGEAKERKTGRPQRPEMKPGANSARLLGCLTREDVAGRALKRAKAAGERIAARNHEKRRPWLPLAWHTVVPPPLASSHRASVLAI